MKTLEFWCENVNKQQSLVRKRYKFWCENVIFVVSKFGVKTLTFGVKTRAEQTIIPNASTPSSNKLYIKHL